MRRRPDPYTHTPDNRVHLDDPPKWRGPVVRRDPAEYAERSAPLVRCPNPYCGQWAAATRRVCATCATTIPGTP